MNLTKSKQRVADHGEVFTPPWMVEAMLDLVKDESERIDNFLVQILRRKLVAARHKYASSPFEYQHYALLGLMCIYGIELLPDNATECRANLHTIFAETLGLTAADPLYGAATHVLALNIVQGDALTMRTHEQQPITFAEWGYLGKGRFQRRDFRYDNLTQSAAYSQPGTLFANHEKHELFAPTRTYPPQTIADLAAHAPEVLP